MMLSSPVVAEHDVLRAHAEHDGAGLGAMLLQAGLLLLGDAELGAVKDDGVLVAGLFELGVEEVHLRCADEAGDEEVRRVVEDLLRGADLLDEAVAHDDDAVAQGHGLGLVVGDVDEGGVDPLAQLDYLRAHLVAELGVEVGQGFVHEEDLRLADDGAADGDTLALAAGEGLRLAVEVLGDVQYLRGLADLLVDGLSCRPSSA